MQELVQNLSAQALKSYQASNTDLLESKCVHWRINACFANEKVVIDNGYVVLCQLNI